MRQGQSRYKGSEGERVTLSVVNSTIKEEPGKSRGAPSPNEVILHDLFNKYGLGGILLSTFRDPKIKA